MSFNESICPGCSRGCNMKIGVRNNEILRLEPATNPYVNNYWLCDYGRLSQYKFVNENRITTPFIKKSDDERENVEWEKAYRETAEVLKKYKAKEIMFLGSAKATCEDNYLLQELAKKIIKTQNVDLFEHIDETFGDDFLKTNDKTPNYAGALEVGVKPGERSVKSLDLAEAIKYGKIKVLYVMDDELEDYPVIIDEADNLDCLIVHAHNDSLIAKKADIVLASSTYAEVEGTYVNADKRAQHFKPALTTAENLRFMGLKMSRLDKFGADNDRWTQHELRLCRPNWKIVRAIAKQLGANWNFKTVKDVFAEIAKQVPAFKNMDYRLLDEYQGLKLNEAEKPDKKTVNYDSHSMKPQSGIF